MIVMQVTLLPQPDSPTISSVSPFTTENEMPSTAPTMPSSVLNEVFRSLTSRRGIVSGGRRSLRESDPRIDPGVQKVHHQVGDNDNNRGEHHHPQRDRVVVLAERVNSRVPQSWQAENVFDQHGS